MAWPPITFEDTHTQNWFPTRGNNPMFIDCRDTGAVMRWGYVNDRPHREVFPWGNGDSNASCSDYEKTSTWDFEIHMEI